MQQLLDALGGIPAVVQNERFDVLAASPLGQALYAFTDTAGPPAQPRPVRLSRPRARELCPERDRVANHAVALLRAAAGRSPDDRVLSDLVGELTTRSDRFSSLWASYTIRAYPPGTKRSPTATSGSPTKPSHSPSTPSKSWLPTPPNPAPVTHALTILASWTAVQPTAT